MRVIQINSVYKQGSTGRIVENLHKAYLRSGIDSYVFYGRGPKIKEKNILKISHILSIIWHGISSRLFDNHGLNSKRVTKRLIRRIKTINPDIIHLHNIHGYYLNYPILFEYFKKIFKGEIVWTMHDCWAFTGHCAYYTYANCDKWESHCQNCPQTKEYPKSVLKDNSYNNFEQKKDSFNGLKKLSIITPSIWLKKEINKSFLSNYHVEVKNNGVDKSIFKPGPSSFRQKFNLENKIIILGVANIWEKRKGLKYIVALLRYLMDDEHIVIIGKSKFLETFTHPSLTHISQTENIYDLADIYKASDVFFNPTLEDNYPTTNLEAIACGTPILTFNSGGSAEALDEYLSQSTNVYKDYETIKLLRHIYQNSKIELTKKLPNNIKSIDEFTQSYIDYYFEITT